MTVQRIKIGGKDDDGNPVHLSPWTFEVPQIRRLVWHRDRPAVHHTNAYLTRHT